MVLKAWRRIPAAICGGLRAADPMAVIELHRHLDGARLPRGVTAGDVEEVISALCAMTVNDAGRCRLSAAHDPVSFVGTLLRDARVARFRRAGRQARLFNELCERTAQSTRPTAEVVEAREALSHALQAALSLPDRYAMPLLISAFEGRDAIDRIVAIVYYAPLARRSRRAAYAGLARARRKLQRVLSTSTRALFMAPKPVRANSARHAVPVSQLKVKHAT